MVVGNWKMSPETLTRARDIFRAVSRQSKLFKNVDIVICPPTLYLGLLKKSANKNFFLGAQNVFWQNDGRFTGEISPEMLKNLGVSCCLVGHSERRALDETDEDVSRKVNGALREGLRVVVCVGERERDSNGVYFEFLKSQLKRSLAGVSSRSFSNIVIAYEPIWAIGKSFRDSMAPADIRETSIFIRKVLSDMYDQKIAAAASIIYGGSVEPENIAAVLKEGGVTGVLVGHKSLVPEDFISILKSANEFK